MSKISSIRIDIPTRIRLRRRLLPPARFYVPVVALIAFAAAACGGGLSRSESQGVGASQTPTPQSESQGAGAAQTPTTQSESQGAGGAQTPTAQSVSSTVEVSGQGDAARAEPLKNENGPDLVGLQEWFNSDPTTIGELVALNRVVLVDFWTYTCINCIRTFPFLKQWHGKYEDRGLTILGVHSPEFEFEKVASNVLAAVERYEMKYPVAQDNNMATWNAFGNRFWPAKYLFDTDGEIIYTHFGEGDYIETEAAIRAALEEAGYDVSDIPLGADEGPQRDPAARRMTRELYGGYARNYSYSGVYAGQPEYYEGPDRVVSYEDAVPHDDNRWYLQGEWRNEREAIVHARRTESLEDYLALKFIARSVNVVISPVAPEPFEVVIEIDERPLESNEAGGDIAWDDEGRSIIRVVEAREYRIVELDEFGEHELKLSSNSPNFAIFAFTFGINTKGA